MKEDTKAKDDLFDANADFLSFDDIGTKKKEVKIVSLEDKMHE